MSNESESRAEEQARLQAADIERMVKALKCDYLQLETLREERDAFVSESPLQPEDAAYKWRAENPDEATELADLEEAANGCSSEDEARERIQNDPLSILVRSDWHAVGEPADEAEFEILLCTGGPAVRIVGELDGYGEPNTARIECQDWFLPWQEAYGVIDSEVLMDYCRAHYFGE